MTPRTPEEIARELTMGLVGIPSADAIASAIRSAVAAEAIAEVERLLTDNASLRMNIRHSDKMS